MFEHTILFWLLGSWITTLITACHCCVWTHYSVLTAWVMNHDAPLCKCKSSVGCQSACSSWNWTHLDPSSAEIYWSIKWRVILKISIHIQKPRICNRLRESISSDNDMSPCSAEAFPQDLPSHCCQQSLQAHWVCFANCVKMVLISENSFLSHLTRQGACCNMQWRHGSRLSGSSSSLQARPLRTLRQRWWPLPEYGLKLKNFSFVWLFFISRKNLIICFCKITLSRSSLNLTVAALWKTTLTSSSNNLRVQLQFNLHFHLNLS